MFNNLNFMYFN